MKHKSKYRIEYRQIDAMGHVHNSEYANLVEFARTELVRDEGYTYRNLEDKGILMPLGKAHYEYIMPLRYDEIVTILTCVKNLGDHSVKFVYEILNENGEVAAKGYTQHGFVLKSGEDFADIPEDFRTILQKYLN